MYKINKETHRDTKWARERETWGGKESEHDFLIKCIFLFRSVISSFFFLIFSSFHVPNLPGMMNTLMMMTMYLNSNAQTNTLHRNSLSELGMHKTRDSFQDITCSVISLLNKFEDVFSISYRHSGRHRWYLLCQFRTILLIKKKC